MDSLQKLKPHLKIGFFSYSYAFNRHNRLKAYSQMLPESRLILFTTNKQRDIQKWSGVPNLDIIQLRRGIPGCFDLIRYCKQNNLKYLTNLGHKTSLPLIFLNKIITGTKYIAHTSQLGGIPLRYALFYKFADKIQVNDEKVYSEILGSSYGTKVYYAPAPTDTKIFKIKNKRECRKKLGLPEKKKIVVYVGRVSKTKGSDLLLSAIYSNKDVLFVIAGDIHDKRFINLTLKNYLYVGRKNPEELVDYYNSADLGFFVILISGGGLAMTSHECLACGTPILIASRKKEGNSSEFVIPVEETHSAVNKALREVFQKDPHFLNSLSKPARKFAIDKCGVSKWSEVYRDIFLR